MPDTAESRLRAVLLAYFPMFIATLSLITSIYNGYLNNRFLDFTQRNTGRTEYLRTCKEIIDGYFQAKMRIGALSAAAGRSGAAAAAEAATAVAHFAALGTYLANLRDETTRERYTRLSDDLEKLVGDAPNLSAEELGKRYQVTDDAFYQMNADSIKTAKDMPL